MAGQSLIDPSLLDLASFRACLDALRSGRLEDAETLARAVLTERPEAADIWHLLGVLATRMGRRRQALDRLGHALELAPRSPAIRFDAAIAAGRFGAHDLALLHLDHVVELRPDHAAAWINRGQALRALERYADALESFERALVLEPALPQALHGRAHALAALNRSAEALSGYEAALMRTPDLADAWIGKGNVLMALERPDDAMACFDHAIGLATSQGGTIETRIHAFHFRGDALRVLRRWDDALASFDQALSVGPDDTDSWLGRGRVLLEMKRFDEALDCYDRVVALAPEMGKGHEHRSRALRELGLYDEALAAAERSLRLKPDDPGGLNSRGNALRMMGRLEEALVDYQRAIEASPSLGPLRFNRAVCLLLRGAYDEGWREYEYRWTVRNMAIRRPRLQQPLWLGQEDIAGRRVLLYAEQGLGDTIQFCRFAPLVAERGATVIVGAQPELRPLLSALDGVHDVVDRSEVPPIFDLYCPFMSLPLALGTTEATIPARVPYLSVPAGHAATWDERLGVRNGPRIGLAWSGNREHRNDHHRSIPLAMLAPLLSAGPAFHCLQRDMRPEDVPSFAIAGNIRFHGPELNDFSDTAALISRMDLVISVDTSVAHLAGALGRPVWLLLPYAPDWRWMLNRDDSPWYPTMRLFRQPAPRDWESVIALVARALTAAIADPPLPAAL